MIQFADGWREAQIHEETMTLIQQQKEKAIFEMLKPDLKVDGNQWCCLWGELPEVCIVGFGDTPANAVVQFYNAYLNTHL
jgi:hypothetical protein